MANILCANIPALPSIALYEYTRNLLFFSDIVHPSQS